MPQPTQSPSLPANPLANLALDERRELLAHLLREKSQQETFFPMSSGQQGLWYAYRRDPASAAFNVFLPTRIRSPLDVDAFRRAMEFLVQRHPSLRTTFTDEQAQLRQRVHARLPPEFTVENASNWSDAQLNQRVASETMRCRT